MIEHPHHWLFALVLAFVFYWIGWAHGRMSERAKRPIYCHQPPPNTNPPGPPEPPRPPRNRAVD